MIIFAIDDEPLALKLLEDSIMEAEPESELFTFTDTDKLLDAAEIKAPDVAFLDIKMAGTDGITLAKRLLEIKSNTNIIFVTGYSEYAVDAFDLYASGYAIKPVDGKAVRELLDNLRYSISKYIINKGLFARTFGNFTLFNNGVPVKFHTDKGKELLAYLIDRKGAVISRKEIAAVLFEEGSFSRSEQRNLSYIVSNLEKDLIDACAEELFCRNPKGYYVDVSKFRCDLYEYEQGRYPDLFKGEYMEQYSWGENFKGLNAK